MVEIQRLPVHRQAIRPTPRNPTVRQIPGAHVITWISQDFQCVEISGGKIHPALVCKDAAGDVVVAEMLQAVGPPIGEAAPFSASTDAEKTEIVYAMPQSREFIVLNSCLVVLGLR